MTTVPHDARRARSLGLLLVACQFGLMAVLVVMGAMGLQGC